MGFSLRAFFEDLQAILRDARASDADKLRALQELVNRQHEYADQCGQLR